MGKENIQLRRHKIKTARAESQEEMATRLSSAWRTPNSTMHQNSNHIIKIPQHWVETRWELNSKTLTETLEQQISKGWTSMGLTKDRASSPNQSFWKCLAVAFNSSQARPFGMQLKREVVNGNWVNHQACTLSHKHALCRITCMLYPVHL